MYISKEEIRNTITKKGAKLGISGMIDKDCFGIGELEAMRREIDNLSKIVTQLLMQMSTEDIINILHESFEYWL